MMMFLLLLMIRDMMGEQRRREDDDHRPDCPRLLLAVSLFLVSGLKVRGEQRSADQRGCSCLTRVANSSVSF
jgi:hypothetical protein